LAKAGDYVRKALIFIDKIFDLACGRYPEAIDIAGVGRALLCNLGL
jgi:hypothetical protein